MEDCGFLKFTDETLKVSFLQTLNTMRKHRLFCDVVLNVSSNGPPFNFADLLIFDWNFCCPLLQVDNADIHAHKNVLACVSPHLMELFSAEEVR